MILLPNRALVKISGEDARKFLQGIITNDIEKLTPENALYAALLSPQGKYLFDFLLYEEVGAILIDVANNRVEELVKKLSMYKLRSKVAIERLEGFRVYYDLETGVQDPRSPKLGLRFITDEPQTENGSLEEYETMRLQIGIPETADFIPEKSFIMNCNFEQLNGVDFKKGCYVGQEVVARMKYKGGIRKAFYRASSEIDLPPIGTPVMAGEKSIGELTSVMGEYGLAICEIEAVADGREYMADGKLVNIAA